MSRCTQPETGNLLHSFELNQLSDSQREAFELHLLSCDHCFAEVSKFDGVAELLRSDQDVRNIIQEAAYETTEKVPFWSKIRSSLWPSTNLFLKPALSYFLILLLALPAFVGIRQWRTREVQSVQSLVLTGVRSPGGNKIRAGEPLVVMFRIEGAQPGSSYRIQVSTDDGSIIFSDDNFTNVNSREMATILLARSYYVGTYTIDIYDSKQDTLLHQYHFTAW
jgi:hypothetical protein